jgi:hypothetical protein
MDFYNQKFKEAFEKLDMSQEDFVVAFNNFSNTKFTDNLPLTQSRLSMMLSGRTFVPINISDFVSETYGINPKFLLGDSSEVFTLKEELSELKEQTGSLWARLKNFFNFKLYNK